MAVVVDGLQVRLDDGRLGVRPRSRGRQQLSQMANDDREGDSRAAAEAKSE